MNRISGFINRSKGLGRPTKREGRELKKFTEGDFLMTDSTLILILTITKKTIKQNLYNT